MISELCLAALWLLAFSADRFEMTGLTNSAGDPLEPALRDLAATAGQELAPAILVDSEHNQQLDWNAWRDEASARLARYRTRRKPRAPRYPSLLLPFDNRSNWSRPSATAAATVHDDSEAARENPPLDEERSHSVSTSVECGGEPEHDRCDQDRIEVLSNAEPDSPLDSSAKVIEFPRSAAIPMAYSNSLADPIVDRPRIVEAPEIVPAPPALGGILIESVQAEPVDRTIGTEAIVQSASIAHRLLASLLDGLILATALTAFGVIFVRFNPVHQPVQVLAAVIGTLGLLLWMAYQFLFVVCTGSTPGLRLAQLRLTKFDGSPVPRRTRRWRVLASFMSGFSAGLGYVWCFLDQDCLCWHDRITRTYIQSARSGQ